ncbi:hypothetical protein [Nocardioides montaniterrae]
MPVATESDVETALGRPLLAAEATQANWWLVGIELAIVHRLGDVSALNQDAVKYVEAEAVAEKLRRRGTNESSITVAVDDGSVTRRFDNPSSADDITDEWWSLLTPSGNAESSSIRPGFEPDAVRWPVRPPGSWCWPNSVDWWGR